MADYLTYANIKARLTALLKKGKGSVDDIIEYVVNMVYLDEIMVADDLYPFHWLVDYDDSLMSKAPSLVSGITQASPGIITTTAAHGLLAGDIFSIHDISGMTELNDRLHIAYAVPSTTQINIGTDTSAYTAYTSGGRIVHKGVTLNVSGKEVDQVLCSSWHKRGSMEEITHKEIEKRTEFHESDVAGLPDRYYHGKSFTSAGVETNQLLWYVGASEAIRLRYWFIKRVSPLVNDADVPILPPKFHNIIISGAMARLVENGLMVENPSIWPSVYTTQLDALRDNNRRYYKQNDKAFREKPYLI